MIKSLTGRIYFGTALTFLTVPVIIILYFSAFRRHDTLMDSVARTEKIADQTATLQQILLELETLFPPNVAGKGRPVKLPGNSLTVAAIERRISELEASVALEPVQMNRLHQVEQSITASLAGETSRLAAGRYQLTQIKQFAQHRLLLQKQADADTDFWEECGMWVAVLVAVTNIAILILVIFEEFRKRRRAERELKANLATLQTYNQESEERNWQLTGLSAISHSLQDQENLEDMAQNIISTLLDHLDLPAGAIYLYQPQDHLLNRLASIGLPANATRTFTQSEGLVGQASRSRQILAVNHVPADYWQLRSGSGHGQPGQLLLVPLWYRKELVGVFELVAFRALEPPVLNLIQRLIEPISVAINSVQTHEQIRALLLQVQQQNELVAAQQEELRHSNEVLIRQAENLQASEEELKGQQEELRQINAELIDKNEAVEVARQSLSLKAQELEVTSQYKSAFLANMSHELRTPLNSVLILAKLLADNKSENLTVKQVEYANVIHKSGNDLLTLINDILDLAKIEAGHIELHVEPVAVKTIVHDLTQLFTVVAEEKKVELITVVEKSVPAEVTTDKLRLEQIIKNLLSNAFKFTPPAGRITLTFSVEQKFSILRQPNATGEAPVLTISVTDTGIGIPLEKQQLIFEAFQQVDGSTSRKYGGTGLGLSISRELIKRLGGEITLQSEEGQGSTFTIWLPVSTKVPMLTDGEQRTIQETFAQPLALAGPLETPVHQSAVCDDRDSLQKGDRVILIIEDDVRFARILQDFAHAKAYKTVVALQGDEGIYYARRYEPSAILLDLQLPVLNGISVLKLLKEDSKLKHIPVHVISASDEPLKQLPGAMAYIKKPVKKQDLEEAFTRIGNRLTERVKNVLVVSGEYLPDNSLTKLINERHFDITCDYAVLNEEALQKVHEKAYDCVIADIGKELESGRQKLRQLQAAMPDNPIPVIIYLDTELSDFDELQLKKLSDTVVHDSVQAKDRLMDQLELFLYKIQRDRVVQLPAPEPVLPRPANEGNSRPASESNGSGKTVLLVDDDMRNVFSISTLLEEDKFDVITASNGLEAIEVLNEQIQVDLVLMDIMMPTMNGYEAMRRIRSEPRFAQLPIIALTAKAMPGDREQCIDAGASDYITKPVDIPKLLSLMHTWLPATV